LGAHTRDEYDKAVQAVKSGVYKAKDLALCQDTAKVAGSTGSEARAALAARKNK